MKRMRIPLLIALGITLVGIILGSFLDLKLSQSIADPENFFGLLISVLTPTIGFTALAMIGGGYLALGLEKKWKVWARVGFFALCAACFGASTYFAGKEFFDVNGFYLKASIWVGFVISGPVMAFFTAIGYFLFRNNDNKYTWIVLAVMAGVIFLALVPGTTLIKIIFHRPRFRSIVASGYEIPFHPWWKPCGNYKALMAEFALTSEEFKSFPSGHTCESTIYIPFIAFLPMIVKKTEKIQLPLFIVSIAFTVLAGFARVLVGAHFLSDVSMGAFLTVLFTFIANEIVMRRKALQLPQEEASPEAAQ